MDRGSTAVTTLLYNFLFALVPACADIIIGIAYFTTAFGSYFGLIVFTTMISYVYVTIAIVSWRRPLQRSMRDKSNALSFQANDSIINAETVKLYGAEAYEVNRYAVAMDDYLKVEWKTTAGYNFLNIVQNIIMYTGLSIGSLLSSYMIVHGNATVGDFVLFIAYMITLWAPITMLGTNYVLIQQNYIDMERMLDLFDIDSEICDSADADTLVYPNEGHGCQIRFENVSFHYESRKPILKNVSFVVEAGKTCAIVGVSGSGKSTIMRLLFRFYDVVSGHVFVHGQDIKKVTQSSLRKGRCLVDDPENGQPLLFKIVVYGIYLCMYVYCGDRLYI